MTLSEIRTRIRLMMPEADTTVINNQDLDILINDAVMDITSKTECIQNYADQTVTADTQEYSKPTDAISITAVYYGGSGNWEKLPRVTMDFLSNEVDEDWFDDTGTIYAYFIRRDKIGLYQIPTSSEAGTDYLRVYYVEQPDTLSDNGDVPFNSLNHLKSYHELIILYVIYHLKQIVGKWQQSDYIEKNYLAKTVNMKVELNRMEDFQQVIRPYHKGAGGSSLKQNPLDQ